MLRRPSPSGNCLVLVTLCLVVFGLGWFSATLLQVPESLEKPTQPNSQPCPPCEAKKGGAAPCPPTDTTPCPACDKQDTLTSTTTEPHISLKDLRELSEFGITEADHTFLYSKPVDLMIVWKHNTRDKSDFAKVYEVDPNEIRIYQEYLLPSLRKCTICANWFFSTLNIWDELKSPQDFQFLHNPLSMISTQHYQKHVLGYSNLTLFTSVDDTVSFNFWSNLEAWIATKPSVEDGKEYCVYPRGQHFVFALENPPKCVPMDQIWYKNGLVLHLMIGVMSKKFYSPQYLDHAEFTSRTTYPNCIPTPIEGEAYYIRRRKSHSSLTHNTFYDDVLAKARPCHYDKEIGQFIYE